ncbi:serine/threonine-protein kinase [Sandaracinus amylolyticus]|uniref:Serine/threonine protein kinase n=1 Tax=Sandaracinus amylolyticus TaxID=927083 RepID=A0A0F6W3M6_9BACT|nr:serine/threonine-protein kinase [Sandaracinus amylolyticus]AKF06643.1 serine/threonine protein kinase [Sandaracinus amylolyticus]
MRIGPYEVIAPLRSGGMASLVLARRIGARGFARLVAMKRVHEHLSDDPAMIRRFVDEARLSSAIAHPAVVRVEDLVEHEGELHLVMEHVHGVTLGRVMDRLRARDRRMRPEVAVAIAAWIAEGLEAAHQAHDAEGRWLGLVHRDVSPSNVLVAASGHVKLIDFGIASARVREHESTMGHVLGKLRYAAPEQLRRDAVDARADVYALGVLLWEMLTCEALFTGGHDALSSGRPAIDPPSRHAPEVSETLDAVVREALAEDPSRRITSARALRDALRASTPECAAIGAPEIAAMLEALVGEELARASDELPVDARTSPGPVSTKALDRMTISRTAPAPIVRAKKKRASTPWATYAIVVAGLIVGVIAGALLAR